MTSDMKDQGFKPHDQQHARGGRVTLGMKSLFSQFFPLLGIWGFLPGDIPYLAYCSCCAHACLTAFYGWSGVLVKVITYCAYNTVYLETVHIPA